MQIEQSSKSLYQSQSLLSKKEQKEQNLLNQQSLQNPWMEESSRKNVVSSSVFMNPFKHAAEQMGLNAEIRETLAINTAGISTISMTGLGLNNNGLTVNNDTLPNNSTSDSKMMENFTNSNYLATPPLSSTTTPPILPFDQDMFEDLVKDLPQFDEFRSFLPPQAPRLQRSNSISVDYSRPRAPRQRFLSAGHELFGCGQTLDQDLDQFGLDLDSFSSQGVCFPNDLTQPQVQAEPFKFISLQDLESNTYQNTIDYQLYDQQTFDQQQIKPEPLSISIHGFSKHTSPPSPPLSPTEYSCEKCPKTFKKLKDWKRHLNTHDHKTYECQDCLKKFSRKDALTRHIKKLRCIFMKRMIKEQKALEGKGLKRKV